MTPSEMKSILANNIKLAREAMDAGPVGYVLHTADHTDFVRRYKKTVYLGVPTASDLAVLKTHRQALTLQRYWNTQFQVQPVSISLRRDALLAYIAMQQMLFDTLIDKCRSVNH